MKFEVGQIVEHLLSKDWLLVIEYMPETDQYLCRTKALQAVAFYSFELKAKSY